MSDLYLQNLNFLARWGQNKIYQIRLQTVKDQLLLRQEFAIVLHCFPVSFNIRFSGLKFKRYRVSGCSPYVIRIYSSIYSRNKKRVFLQNFLLFFIYLITGEEKRGI